MGPDGPRDGADADGLASALQADGVTRELGIPAGSLEAEGGRLGVDAMAASHHRCLAVLASDTADDLDEPRELILHDSRRVTQDDGGGGVEDVRAREPVVEPAPLRAEPLRDRAEEGDDVVL